MMLLTPGERCVTAMASARNPTVRRRELGVLLRALRNDHDWTVDYVAEKLECSPSKVSRMETGHRGASARDIRELCDLYGVDDEHRQHLMTLASEGKQRAWWSPLGLPYSTYVGLEAEADSISDFGLGTLPGLLQTPDYARAVVRAVAPQLPPDVVEQRVNGRIARQQTLTSDAPPRFEAVIEESVLHRVVGSAVVMASQLSRLLDVSELPNVGLRVIPYEAGALPVVTNKFIILRFHAAAIPDVVFIEGLTGDLYLDAPEDVKAYFMTFSSLVGLAADADGTRDIIGRELTAYRARSQ
jgi:transcriptional regulator with XRE-family HTH domain